MQVHTNAPLTACCFICESTNIDLHSIQTCTQCCTPVGTTAQADQACLFRGKTKTPLHTACIYTPKLACSPAWYTNLRSMLRARGYHSAGGPRWVRSRDSCLEATSWNSWGFDSSQRKNEASNRGNTAAAGPLSGCTDIKVKRLDFDHICK